MTRILGISAFTPDAGAALVVDGDVVAVVPEESSGFPSGAIARCLERGGVPPERLDFVGFHDKPLLKLDRVLETYFSTAPRGFLSFVDTMPAWLGTRLRMKHAIDQALQGRYRKRIVFTERHEALASSAFFSSPFEEAAILTLDTVGEWATASYGTGRGNRVRLTHELRFPHSMGFLVSAFASFCGFPPRPGDPEFMALAAEGSPRYESRIRERILDMKPDGSFRVNRAYFDFGRRGRMISRKFEKEFGAPRRPGTPVTHRERDLAASMRNVLEEVLSRAARHLHRESGMAHLCLAGHLARNPSLAERMRRLGPFENVWTETDGSEAGGALGTALFIWHQLLNQPRQVQSRALGPERGAETRS